MIAWTSALVLGFLFLAASPAEAGCSNGCWTFEYDGCSVPAELVTSLSLTNELFGKDNPGGGVDTGFTNSRRTGPCDRHDECYQTCDGPSRSACDYQMKIDMEKVCAASKEVEGIKANCRQWTALYHTALEKGAQSAFNKRRNEVCGCGAPCQAARWLGYPPCDVLKRSDGEPMQWASYLIVRDLPGGKLEGYKPIRNHEEYAAYLETCR